MQSINTKRRAFLGVIMAATATALLLPLRAVAAIWNKAAFDAISSMMQLKILPLMLKFQAKILK